MVIESIKALKDKPKKGSSYGSIKETILLNWPVNLNIYEGKIRRYIVKALDSGEIIQTRGKGFRGRFTVPGMRRYKKRKKAKVDKEEVGEVCSD